jgi:neutral amino acid transport system ATP-binding protein
VSAAPLLRVEGLRRAYGAVRAIDGVSFSVNRGTLSALIGPNGSGKSTLFNVLSGFDRAATGDVAFDGRSILGRAPHVLVRTGLVRTFQVPRALPTLTVLDNLMVASASHPGDRLVNSVVRRRRVRHVESERSTEAKRLLERVGLGRETEALAGSLSGGQRKLLELARALMTRPVLLLLDEPLAGVSPSLRLRLLDLIREVRDGDGTTVLFIEHDIDAVVASAERVVVMAEGRIIGDGSPDAIRTDAAVLDAYLGGGRAVGEERPRDG